MSFDGISITGMPLIVLVQVLDKVKRCLGCVPSLWVLEEQELGFVEDQHQLILQYSVNRTALVVE